MCAKYLVVVLALTSCGYSIRKSESSLFSEHGIKKIYIAPLGNSSYKPGAETLVYNAVLKRMKANIKIEMVTSEAAADAVLVGELTNAQASGGAEISSTQLKPSGFGNDLVYLNSEYNAGLSAKFTIKQGIKSLWSQDFGRSKVYLGHTGINVRGTTTHLINESEFDRTLVDLADQVSEDLTQALLQL